MAIGIHMTEIMFLYNVLIFGKIKCIFLWKRGLPFATEEDEHFKLLTQAVYNISGETFISTSEQGSTYRPTKTASI